MTNHSKTLYIGVTNNLKRRVYEHKKKQIDGFTKNYNINKLVFLKRRMILNQQLKEKSS